MTRKKLYVGRAGECPAPLLITKLPKMRKNGRGSAGEVVDKALLYSMFFDTRQKSLNKYIV